MNGVIRDRIRFWQRSRKQATTEGRWQDAMIANLLLSELTRIRDIRPTPKKETADQ